MVIDQRRCIELFAGLKALREDWGGALIFRCNFDEDGGALAVAAHIAGAVTLIVESDIDRSKAALKAGACDFLVNHLDEALRTMKNEIRKHARLTVVLNADTNIILEEMRQRGVYPDLYIADDNNVLQPAAMRISIDELAQGKPLYRIAAPTALGLRSAEQAAREYLTEDVARAEWLRYAPSFFRRSTSNERLVWLSQEEATALIQQLPAGATIEPLFHPAS